MEFKNKKRARPVPTEATTNTSTTSKRRRQDFADDGDREVPSLHIHRGSNVQHRRASRQRQLAFVASNSVSPQNSVIDEGAVKDQCPRPTSGRFQMPDCPSSDSSGEVRDDTKFSDGLDEAAKDGSYSRTINDDPTIETEMEEFFAAAENHMLNIFIRKYNYDFSKDIPLKGCYEWV